MNTISKTSPASVSTTKQPSLYQVQILNDDYTTIEFVEYVLTDIFKKPSADAHNLALQIHLLGYARIGTYAKDIAHTYSEQTNSIAQQHGFPLVSVLRKCP